MHLLISLVAPAPLHGIRVWYAWYSGVVPDYPKLVQPIRTLHV